jgi:hypothetical protein
MKINQVLYEVHIEILTKLVHMFKTQSVFFNFQVSQKQLFNSYVSWLIVAEKTIHSITIEDRLRYFSIGPDTDLVIATKIKETNKNFPGPSTGSRTHNWGDRNVATNNESDRSHGRGKRSDPLSGEKLKGERNFHIKRNWNHPESVKRHKEEKRRKSNRNKKDRNYLYNEIGNCIENPNRTEYSGLGFSLLQVYKIRQNSNSSLVMIPLGSWNATVGTSNLVFPDGIERRNDFRGLPLFVGVRNATLNTAEVGGGAAKDTTLSAQSSEDEIEDDNHLMDLLEFIVRSLNARFVM